MTQDRLRRTGERVERFKARGARYAVPDSVVPGLQLRVASDGSHTWSLWVRQKDGQAVRLTLGDREMSLKAARDRAIIVRAGIKKGEDPAGEIRAERAAVRAKRAAIRAAKAGIETPGSLSDVGARCLNALQLRPSTAYEWARLLRVEIEPAFRGRMAKDITGDDISSWSQTLGHRKPVIANRSFSLLRRIYSWAASKKAPADIRLDRTPMAGLEKPFEKEQPNLRQPLSENELDSILRALDVLDHYADVEGESAEHVAAYVDVCRLLLLTGVRRAAALGAKRSEFSGLTGAQPKWTIPGGAFGRSKNQREFVVPLSPAALEVVRRRIMESKGEHLFPSREDKAKKQGDRARAWDPKFVRLLVEVADEIHGEPIQSWRVHDFRMAIVSNLRGKLKVPGDVCAQILDHTPPGADVTRRYLKANLEAEHRQALVSWALWLTAVRRGPTRAAKAEKFLAAISTYPKDEQERVFAHWVEWLNETDEEGRTVLPFSKRKRA